MRFGICTLDDFDYKGKTVLCRIDINQPIDKKTNTLKDTTRIEACVKTIRELSDKGAKVVLLAHQGSDVEYKNYYTTQPHAQVLTKLLGKTVEHIDDVCGPYARDKIKALKPGEIILLDNVRFMAEEMTLFETKLNLSREEQSKAVTVQKLAPLGDLYVCDAFAAAHRSQPTLVGFEDLLPSAMGRLFEEEFCVISGLMESPEHPCVFILGGAKIQDAFMMMSTVLDGGTADLVLTGGLAANIILMAKGIDIGKKSTDFIYANNLGEYIGMAKSILEKHADRIALPVDFAYVNAERKEIMVDELPVDELLVDIGHKTVENYVDIIKKAKTIFVNGPMGVFEEPETEYGTRTLWNAIADADGYSVVGGGDSVAAANRFGIAGKMSYICTGGGALIRFLTGEELPVVSALRYAAQKFGFCKTDLSA